MAGRPAAPIHISNNILHCSALANFDCTSKVLYEHVSDCMQWLLWLAEHRLVHSSNVCSNCGGQMSLTRRLESSDSPDIQGGPKQVSPYWSVGVYFFGPPCTWRCRAIASRVRTGSFFAHCGLSTEKIVMMVYYWVYEVKGVHVNW